MAKSFTLYLPMLLYLKFLMVSAVLLLPFPKFHFKSNESVSTKVVLLKVQRAEGRHLMVSAVLRVKAEKKHIDSTNSFVEGGAYHHINTDSLYSSEYRFYI